MEVKTHEEYEKTYIKSVRAVNKEGSNYYEVGREVNGLVIHEILDKSAEWEDSIDFMYVGKTECGAVIFEIINIGVDVQYAELKED